MKVGFIVIMLFLNALALAQSDSIVFRHYDDNLTIYTLTGFNSTQVSINPKFGDFSRQRFVFNPPVLFGFGVAYKGFDLGITRRLPFYLLNQSKYGKSDYFDLKLKFSWMRIRFAIRAQNYSGFALLNHEYDNPVLAKPHLFIPDVSTYSFNVDARYFLKKDFSYKAAMGFSGEYLQDFFTPYVYGYFGWSGMRNENRFLLPDYVLSDSASISMSRKLGCIELGAIPGIAYVKRHKKFQGTILLGWGPLIQAKWHGDEVKTKRYFGFSSRTDLQWSLGYHSDSWFIQLMSEIQFRRINFSQMNFQQSYYDLRLYFGYLIPVKKHPKFVLRLEEKGLL